MSCTWEDELTAFVDGELDALTARKVGAHLNACDGCRSVEALLRRTVSQLDAPPAFQPSAALRRQVLESVDTPSLGDRFGALLGPKAWVPAGALAAAAAISIVASRDTEEVPIERAEQLELARHLDLLRDLELVGLESPEDLEIVQHLDELEAMP